MKKVAELLIYPLIVGLIVAVVAFGLPLLTQKEKVLEFKVDSPTAYISPNRIGDLDIVINGIKTKHLNSYHVTIKNAGDVPIKKIPIRYIFSNPEPGFKILTEFHRTDPPYEFGAIDLLQRDTISIRYEYQLLNPGDIAEVTILTTKIGALNLFAKQEGMSFEEAQKERDWESYTQFLLVGVATLGSLLSTFLKTYKEKVIASTIRKVREALTGSNP